MNRITAVRRTIAAVFIAAWSFHAHAQDSSHSAIVANRAPLVSTPFAALPLGSVRPQGWLLRQCELQRDGLTGNAEELYPPDLGTNSAWLGGTGENWERGPYYYKGLVALAYTLNDDGLKRKAQKWIDWLLDHQGADGYIGPKANNDWWPRMVATYALKDYFEATGDARVPIVLSNYFHYALANLPARPLIEWGKARAGDEMDVALWLYNRNGDTNLLQLVTLLQQQAYNWTGIFTSNTFAHYGRDFMPEHNVNVEEALKMPAVYYQLSHRPEDRNALSLGLNHLMRDDGLAIGINGGTESLAGGASTEGVELCATVEAMLSLETAVRITGETALADRLETIAFNALPAALGNHTKALQYYTLPNTAIAVQGGHGFNEDYANGILPGPDSGFPCCRCNFHMGWPKFAQNSWAATTDGGLAVIAYSPTVVSTTIGGEPVRITEDTAYPFEERVRLRMAVSNSIAFPLALRIPGWCSNATVTVNEQPQAGLAAGSFFRINRRWNNGDVVEANLPMPLQMVTGPSRSVAINRGPLVYSLRIGEDWSVHTPDRLGRGFDEFEIRPTTPWNYALDLNLTNLSTSLTFTDSGLATDPFDSAQPSVALLAHGRRIAEWGIGWRGTHAFEPPLSPVASTNALEEVTLVPFGSRHLHVSWFPILGEPEPTVGFFTENLGPAWTRRWTVFGGHWTARNGSLSTVPGSANGSKALAMATAFTNFTYEADVSAGSLGNAGLIFRVSKPDIGADAYCGYYVGINAQDSRLEFGWASNSWHALTNVPITVNANRPYHLKVEAQGDHFKIFFGDANDPVIDIRDGSFAGGMIGVRNYCPDANQSYASFANIAAIERVGDSEHPFSLLVDTNQILERTCFQTSRPWSPRTDLRSDVAIVYGIDARLPSRIETWRERGYRIHVMTGVAWGNYQDYMYGRFDGTNHEDEAQTERNGNKIGHGGDVYYMCPGINYGKFLCVGVQRALDAGAEAIHLEEPEFWDRAGWGEGFKREWKDFYHDDWQAPDSSVDARWRAGKLKYFLYRRALQQVFDYVQAYNQRTGRHVRCYVPTHSLLNYAQWCIVSPESSLAQLNGCDGYIAQVWTGTSREPNRYRGLVRSRTFETAFLEYGAMQNLVRSTGRSVWYLNDPIEDNGNHDWNDYRGNWESTLTASLFQPNVSHYEVAPWPERIFNGRYPRSARGDDRKPIPAAYATELQTVFSALNDMDQSRVEWDSGTTGVGVLVSDSLMFQRGQPTPSDPHLGNVYGLAMPLLMHGVPVAPVQLENDVIAHNLDGFRILFLSYDGQKPLTPAVHAPLAEWVRRGGVLVVCDEDADPYLKVHEWWNSDGKNYATPREHLFEVLGLNYSTAPGAFHKIGEGGLIWLRKRPAAFSADAAGAAEIVAAAKLAADSINLNWRETGYLLLRRGSYVIGAGLDESDETKPRGLHGRFVNLFDSTLQVTNVVTLTPRSRWYLVDLDVARTGKPHLLASACKAVTRAGPSGELSFAVEGIDSTPAVMLMESPQPPVSLTLAGQPLSTFEYSSREHLLWIHFDNAARARELSIRF